MGIALFVVQNSPLLDRLFGNGEIDLNRIVGILGGAFDGQLKRVEQAAGITIGDIDEMVDRLGADRDLALAIAALSIVDGALQ